MHILINPTGQPGKFRAVDWAVELLNLFTKVAFASSSDIYMTDDTIGYTQWILFEQNNRKHPEGITACRNLSTTGENDQRQLPHHGKNNKAPKSKYEENIRGAPCDDGEEWYACEETRT